MIDTVYKPEAPAADDQLLTELLDLADRRARVAAMRFQGSRLASRLDRDAFFSKAMEVLIKCLGADPTKIRNFYNAALTNEFNNLIKKESAPKRFSHQSDEFDAERDGNYSIKELIPDKAHHIEAKDYENTEQFLLQAAQSELSRKEYLALRAFIVEPDAPQAQIAEQIGMNLGSFRRELNTARRKLRNAPHFRELVEERLLPKNDRWQNLVLSEPQNRTRERE